MKPVFKKMNADSDYFAYQTLVEKAMHPLDVVSSDELKEMVDSGKIHSWYVFLENEITPIGWMSIMTECLDGKDGSNDGFHLLGVVVSDQHRGAGFGKYMVNKIISENPDANITAAIQPSNIPSQKLFASLGFVNQGKIDDEVWDLWLLSRDS